MKISSPAFANDNFIPEKYTCDGENINPPLVIDDLPQGTVSLVVIVDDPDAVRKVWVHWVAYNIPMAERIGENTSPGMAGMNDFGKAAYGGPCPHAGAHRYRFKVYALNAMLNLRSGASLQEVESAMICHILGMGVLAGRYRNRKDREAATAR